MKVKLLLFGESVNIPYTGIGMGIGFISVWMDHIGFTSASNQLGSLGYIFIETQEVNIGELDDERKHIFSNLHARTVTFNIAPTVFAIDGGIARITMSTSIQDGGHANNKTIDFVAENCRGICAVSNPLQFTCEMLQMENAHAVLDADHLISDEIVAAIVENAPATDPNEANV